MIATSEQLLERDLQAKCVAWWNRSGLSGVLFHIPNEGKRSRLEAASLGALGVIAGAPDFVLLLPNGRTHLIELKAEGGVQSAEQRRFERDALVLGHTYDVVRNIEGFIGSVRMAGRFHARDSEMEIAHHSPLP